MVEKTGLSSPYHPPPPLPNDVNDDTDGHKTGTSYISYTKKKIYSIRLQIYVHTTHKNHKKLSFYKCADGGIVGSEKPPSGIILTATDSAAQPAPPYLRNGAE